MIALDLLPISWTAIAWMLSAHAAKERGLTLDPPRLELAVVAMCGALIMESRGVAPHVTLALVTIAVGAIVDARCGYIFDLLVAAGLLVALGAASAEGHGIAALVGSLAAGSVLLCIWVASSGRGLGLGDVKLAAVLGAGFGLIGGIVAIGLSFVVGAGVAVGLLATRKVRPGSRVRFGPYLLAGSLCFLAYHQVITGVIQ